VLVGAAAALLQPLQLLLRLWLLAAAAPALAAVEEAAWPVQAALQQLGRKQHTN
jgi:hypothetical protein